MSKNYSNFSECNGKKDITIFEVSPKSGEIVQVDNLSYSEYSRPFNGKDVTYISLEKNGTTYVSGIELEKYKNKNVFKEMEILGYARIFLSVDDALKESESIINGMIDKLSNLNEKMHKHEFRVV